MTDTALFAGRDTSLKDITEAGWRIEHSSGGGWWFRHGDTQERYSVPFWIRELVGQARSSGEEAVQHNIRVALGLTDSEK